MNNDFVINYQGYWREANVSGIPTKSGVYTVYTCSYDSTAKTVGLNKIVYIGESGNVNQRIASHEKWSRWKKHLRQGEQICISFASINSSDRVRVEAALIFQHQPPENSEYIGSFPFPQTSVNTSGENALLKSSFTVYPTNASMAARR